VSHFPEEFRYSEDHIWLRLEDDSRGQLGVTEAFIRFLGEPTKVEFLAAEGDDVVPGQVLVRLSAAEEEGEVTAPVEAQILEINAELADSPDVIADDPYEDGWLVRLEMPPVARVADLLTAEEYQEHVAEELIEFEDMIEVEDRDDDFGDQPDLDEG